MRRTGLGLAFLTLLSVTPLAAQQLPSPAGIAGGESRVEVSLGYSYVRARTVISTGCCFNMHGGSVSVVANLNPWFGLVGDFGGAYASNVQASSFTLSLITYTFGPRFSLHRSDRITPFVHALFGGAHAGGTLYTRGFTQGSPGGRNSFATNLGGGLDLNLTPRVAIRVVQADWLFTKFPNGVDNRQHNLRLTTGIVFRFGSR